MPRNKPEMPGNGHGMKMAWSKMMQNGLKTVQNNISHTRNDGKCQEIGQSCLKQ